jgi:hypothetical protein
MTATEIVTESGMNGAEILMPVASASASEAQNRGGGGRVSTPARVRLPVTLRDVKVGARVREIPSDIRAGLRRWWLLAARPPTLRAWLRLLHPDPTRVPGDSDALRRLWTADNHTTGALMLGLSVAFLLLGGVFRWLACHPLRRWTFYILTAALAAWCVAG